MKSDVVKSSRPETNKYIEMDKKGYGPTYLASSSLTLGVRYFHFTKKNRQHITYFATSHVQPNVVL